MNESNKLLCKYLKIYLTAITFIASPKFPLHMIYIHAMDLLQMTGGIYKDTCIKVYKD